MIKVQVRGGDFFSKSDGFCKFWEKCFRVVFRVLKGTTGLQNTLARVSVGFGEFEFLVICVKKVQVRGGDFFFKK